MGRSALVVGAGISGLCCARGLVAAGWSVRVVDKGRSVGGRTCSRGDAKEGFDHGAQFFTTRDQRFRALVDEAFESGVIEPFSHRVGILKASGELVAVEPGEPRYVGTPRMGAFAAWLARPLEVRSGVEVHRVERERGIWAAYDTLGQKLAQADSLVVAIPNLQAHRLLGDRAPAAVGATTRLAPTWALMLELQAPLHLASEAGELCALELEQSPLRWMSRSDPTRWTIHANTQASREHLEDSPERACVWMLDALRDALPNLPARRSLRAHRWRYAFVDEPLGQAAIVDPSLALGLCGDWCLGPRVELAALSGMALADALVAEL